MNIRYAFLYLLLTSLFSFTKVSAGGNITHHDDPLRKTFITNTKRLPDEGYQKLLFGQPFWKKFVDENGPWYVMFNESSAMPHRAYGKPIAVPGFDVRSTADNFISDQLNGMMRNVNELNFVSVSTNSKYHYVNYKQYFQGLEILFSKVQIKMTHDFRVNQFALDCYRNIPISINPGLDAFAAAQFARQLVPGVQQITVHPNLKILPVPELRSYSFHLVYEVLVENIDADGIPAKYYTLVDANNGEVLYRSNHIYHFSNTDVNISGSMYLTHPYNPSSVEPMKNMRIVVGGIPYFSDNSGNITLSNTSNVNATFSLQGKWVKIQTNNVTPTWVMNLSPGANNIDIDLNNTDIKQRTTYNAINTIHEYMKSKFPSFTSLDFPMDANIDVPGTCNAYYDGSSVNFFDAGGGCNATSLVVDVCYHEYGHAINDWFYQSLGTYFENGAMHEGYADLWALGITTSPILGIGFFTPSTTGYVRRYDINKKVYPQNLVGQVHADGEIIAGCFWDTGINLGNLQQMMDLFKETYYAGITGPDGDEGTIFPDILLETLMQDDNDGDITNGTPNYCPIAAAFDLHGIVINPPFAICSPVANFTYMPAVICQGSAVTFFDASAFADTWSWSFPGGTPSTSTVKNPVIIYNTAGIYDVSLTITNSVGSNTLTQNGIVNVLSGGAGLNPVPYAEGFETIIFPGPEWSVTNDGGNAWMQNNIAAKTGVNSVYVDNFNGNVQGSTDVFYSPSYDFTGVTGAIMTFQLALALSDSVSNDRLKVFASTNCGVLWNIRYVKIGSNLATANLITTPFTPTSNDWRMETVNLASSSYNNKPNVLFKFEYVYDNGNNIFIDDINISGLVGMDENYEANFGFSIYPNPVSEGATVNFVLNKSGIVVIDVLDVLGREVKTITESKLDEGEYQFEVPPGLSNGVYHVRVIVNETVLSRKIFINK